MQKKTMFSPSLNRKLSFRMTTHAMRCVKKAGGIEEYLIKTPDATIKYDKAIAIKRELIEIRKEQRKELKQAIEKSEAGVAVDAVGVNNDIGVLKKTPVAKLRSAGLLDALE